MEHRNKKYKTRIIAGLVIILFLAGCYYDNEEYLYPQSAICETENMSYTNDIKPVINARCIGCHGGDSPVGIIPLGNYDDVATAAAISPGNFGSLYGAVSHASGNSPMPQGADKLSDCTIDKIKAWIDQGALEE